LLDLKLL